VIGRAGALFVVAVAGLVSVAMGRVSLALLRSGRPALVAVGVVVPVLLVVSLVLAAAEIRLVLAGERLRRRLGKEGGLPFDPPGVQRLPSGGLPAEAAQAQLAVRDAEVQQARQDWRCWWRLAEACRDARDPGRGRKALRQAVALERAERRGADAP